jgi:hypothetical protein
MKKIIPLVFLCAMVYSAYPQWTLLSDDFVPNISVTAFDSTVIAGISSFGAYNLAISLDDGNSWTGSNLLQTNEVEYLCTGGSMVYACTPDGIYRTAKDSLNWSPYNEGLPYGPIHKICMKDSILLAIGDSSLYKRIAGDTAWTRICSSSPVYYNSDFDYDGTLIVLAGNGVAESYDMGLSWTVWTDYVFEFSAVTLKGDTIVAASKGGMCRKIISSGNISQVSSGLIKLWNPLGIDYYGEFKMFHKKGDTLLVCGETGVYKLSDVTGWYWENTGLEGWVFALADNGEMVFAVKLYRGIWGRPLDQLNGNPDDHHALLTSVNIYPNPANDVLNIQFDKINVDALLILSDIQGNAVLSRQIQQEKTGINIGLLPPGVYIIRLENNKELLTRKLVVF